MSVATVHHASIYTKGGGGASGGAPVGKSTGATAGSPGTWTPTGSRPPASAAEVTGVTASPATNWTTGQHMVCRDGSTVNWNGTSWVAGVHA